MKNLFLVSFLLIASYSYSQININTNPFWKGEVELTDGTIKNGYIQVPNVTDIKRIAYKSSPNGSKENIKRKVVKSVKVISENGNEYVYERLAVAPTLKGNASLGKELMLIEAKNDYVTFYISSGSYKVDKDSGELVLVYRYVQGSDFPAIGRYIRKRHREKANMFYVTNYVGGFKRCAKHHLQEDTDLLKKIENGELGRKDIPEIISTYLKTTDSL